MVKLSIDIRDGSDNSATVVVGACLNLIENTLSSATATSPRRTTTPVGPTRHFTRPRPQRNRTLQTLLPQCNSRPVVARLISAGITPAILVMFYCHLRPQYPQNRKYITHRNATRERPSGHGRWQDVHKFGEVWCSTNMSKQTDKHTYSLQHFTAICEDKVMREKISDITDLCGAPYNTAMQRNATHPI